MSDGPMDADEFADIRREIAVKYRRAACKGDAGSKPTSDSEWCGLVRSLKAGRWPSRYSRGAGRLRRVGSRRSRVHQELPADGARVLRVVSWSIG